MATNILNFNQAATVLNSILTQATGQSAPVATNTADFVTQAKTALLTGFDTMTNAISQVLGKTIFSTRPYSAKFKGLEMSESQWGNMTRKLSIADNDLLDDDAYLWPVGYDSAQSPPNGNGQSVDPFKIYKPDFLQTNFYGSSVYEYAYTLHEYQLAQAVRSPEEFAQLISMIVQNRSDKLEQARENTARAVIANYIGGIIAENSSDRIVHLITEYNTLTGLSLTAQDIYLPANFKPFMQYVYSRIAAVCALMTERSEMFQTVVNSKHIMRHTPYRDQRVYLYAPIKYQAEMMAIADVYHDNYLRLADNETVNFWQGITSGDEIKVTAGYTATDGSTTSAAVSQTGVFGFISDREAAGYAITQARSYPMFNGRGAYTTYWDHCTFKAFNDFTEKGVVLLLD